MLSLLKNKIKLVLLLLLLLLTVLIPDIMLVYPAFVGYCFPVKYSVGVLKYVNISLNIILAYTILVLDILFLNFDMLSENIFIFLLRKFDLIGFYMFFFLSFWMLLVFKYFYKLRIDFTDILIHFLGLLFINYLSETLAELLIKREHFRIFIMSQYLLFIFYSIYCILKVDRNSNQIGNPEII